MTGKKIIALLELHDSSCTAIAELEDVDPAVVSRVIHDTYPTVQHRGIAMVARIRKAILKALHHEYTEAKLWPPKAPKTRKKKAGTTKPTPKA